MRLAWLLLLALPLRTPAADFHSAWSSTGDRIAYSVDNKLWIADVATGKTRPVHGLSVPDDCRFLWQPAGPSLLLWCSNSLSSVNPATGRVRPVLTSPSHLTYTEFSPNGVSVTFIRDHNLWQMPASGGACRQLTTHGSQTLSAGEPDPVMAHELAIKKAYWWSPDSSAIAYIETDTSASGPYPLPGKALPSMKLVLLSLASGQESDIVAGTADRPYLANAAWLPDSKRLAFQSLNRLQTQLDLNLYECAPAATRLLFTEKDLYWINLPDAPVFLDKGGRFLITSERTGHRHIYLFGLDGRVERDLTPGNTEVSGPLTLDAAHFVTYFSALADNLHDLQLYRTALDGSAPQPVTREGGWHETEINPAASAFVDYWSTADRPGSATLRHMDDTAIVRLSNDVAAVPLKAEFFDIKTHDNVPLPAMMWKPPGFDAKARYPVIVYTLSGPQGHVVKNAWGGWQNAWNRAMAEKGYLVVAVDVRGSGGYGHYFEEYIHYRLGAQETVDLREVFSYLSRLPYVDSQRVGIWGCDYGAHVAVHAMLEFPHGFKAGFADSPITEWTLYDGYFTERYLGLPQGRFNEYHDSSALDNARRMDQELMVAFSPANPFIRADQVEALNKALAKVNKRAGAVEFPDANYHEEPASLARLMKTMTDFFSTSLSAGHL